MLFLTWPTSQVPGTRQKVVVRSRLAAAVCGIQIACEVQRVGKIGPWRDCAGRSGRWSIEISLGESTVERYTMDQTINILNMPLITKSLWLGRGSATESLKCFQKAAELCTFWV